MKNILFFTICVPLLAFARTEVCPDTAPTMIAPQFEVTVKLNKKTQVYTYDYKVTNQAQAVVPLWRFSIEADGEPLSVTTAKGWENGGYNKENNEIYWNFNSESKSGSSLKPGKSLEHFSVESKSPPGLVRVWADGDVHDVPTVKFETDEAEVDADKVACPGFFKGIGNDDQTVSVITGPALTRRVEAKIRIKRPDENLWKGNPEEEPELQLSPLEKGVAELVVFSSKLVDVTRIKLVSLQLGTGHAKINPAKVVIRADFKESVDSDAFSYLQKNKGNYLKVEFNIQDLNLRCNADRALFLTGDFDEGFPLFGAVKIKAVACDEKTFAPEAKRQRAH